MAYDKQTWADNDPAYPASAARMSHIEDGIAAAAAGGTIHTVAGAPAAALGVDNDFAYNPGTYEWYGPKAGGAWPAAVSLKGAQGDPAVELAYAELASGNWVTTGAGAGSETDITGLSNTFVMPNRAVMLEAYIPTWSGNTQGKLFTVRLRKVSGAAAGYADGADLAAIAKAVYVANLNDQLLVKARLDPTIWIPGTQYTFKAMGNVNTAGGIATIFATATSRAFLRAV